MERFILEKEKKDFYLEKSKSELKRNLILGEIRF